MPNSPFRANFCRGWPKVLICAPAGDSFPICAPNSRTSPISDHTSKSDSPARKEGEGINDDNYNGDIRKEDGNGESAGQVPA